MNFLIFRDCLEFFKIFINLFLSLFLFKRIKKLCLFLRTIMATNTTKCSYVLPHGDDSTWVTACVSMCG